MAFQVLGDTVIDQNQIITSPKLILEGTSASESVLSSSLNGDSKLEIKADGSATFQGPIKTQQDSNSALAFAVTQGGTANSNATIRFDGDGDATFKGTVTADSTTATNGVFNGSLNGSITSYVLANGAAAFAGGNGVSTNQSFGIDQYGRVSIREDASGLTDVFAILKGSSTTKTCTISNDGTVTAGLFASTGTNNTGVEAGSGGLLSVQRGPSSGTSDVFRGYQGATVNTRIRANGSAEFSGTVAVGGLTVGGSSVDTSSQVDSKISTAINAIPATDLSNYDTSTEVTNKINTLLGGAPAALDTLNELAAAIGDDANFAATITGQLSTINTQLSGKADSSSLSSYLRSDTSDSFSGQLTFTGTNEQKIVLSGASNPYIRFQEGTSNKAYIQWHSNGSFYFVNQETAEHLRIGSGANGLVYHEGGSDRTVWHSGNDGSGTGLDADKLDGQEGSYYRNASNINAGTFPDRFSSSTRYNIGYIDGAGVNSYDKLRVWDSSHYTIGMHSGQTFGWLNDYAMTFQMNNDGDRGFVWRHSDMSSAQGAMSLTTGGNLCVGNAVAVGGQTTRYLREPTGQYGSIQISGSGYSGWEGFSIDGRAVFMHDGGSGTGIYNDVNNEWLFYGAHNSYTAMYHNGIECIKTTGSSSATIGGNTIVHTAGTGLSKSGSTVSLNINGLPAL